MSRTPCRIALFSLSLAALAGCPGETPAGHDASSIRPDADLLIEPADASGALADTGSLLAADTGTLSSADTGSLPADAGELAADTGSLAPDTGLLGADTGSAASPDTGTLPAADAGTWACGPVNPCDTPDNRAKHQTRCMGTTSGGYTCNCDVSPVIYHSDNGLCCPPYAANSGGQCVCGQGYLEDAQGLCQVVCSEDTIEGLHGLCPAGKVCLQGVCITDLCIGFTCPANATCSVKDGAANCTCTAGLHLDGDLCCQAHASNELGTCQCDTGYHADQGSCVPDAGNKCANNPCEFNSGHKTACVTDTSAQGYHCACAENYVDQAGTCTLQKVATCPGTLQCLAGYCISDPASQTCLTSADCKEFNPDPNFQPVCNAEAAGGICLGCTAASDCPGNSQCMSGLGDGICALMCVSDSDCPFGSCYTSTGYCGQRRCSSNADCFSGTLCLDGMCRRIPCVETACSPTKPDGTCPNAGEACIAGKCVASCSPNPCTGLNQSTCVMDQGKPSCPCESGTVKDASGVCAPPTVATCPNSMICQSKYCVDRTTDLFACGVSADCGGALACSASSPTGRCMNCFTDNDCPLVAEKCFKPDPTDPFSSGYCLSPCLSDIDCNPANKCNSGYCGTRTCTRGADCGTNYGCFPSVSGGGICQRLKCQ